MLTKDYPLSKIRCQTRSFLRNCFFLSAIITLYSLSAISQVRIHERVTIQANKLGVDSTGKYMPGQKAISPPINKSTQTTAAMITVPESSYVTIAVVSADAASVIDLILRSPFDQTIIPDANGDVGAKWESPFFSTETVLDVGIFWIWRHYSGYEYGVEMTQVAENEYILYFEDLGDSYGPYIDYDDLVVDVRIHGKPDHLNVTVDPDSISYGGYTDITAVAIDNEGNEMPLGDNAIMTLSAEPSSTGSFYPSNEVLYWDLRNGYVSYLEDQEQSPCTQDVVITVSGEGSSGTANVVVKGTPCIVMSTSSDRIHPGGSVDMTMQQLDCSGNLMPYPADQYFYIWMNSDLKYGKLRDQSGNEDSFVGGVQPFKFIAADSIDVDTTVVEIEAWAWSGGGGASRIAGGGVRDTLGNPPIASTTLNEIARKHANLEEKLKKRLAEVKAAARAPLGPVSLGVKYKTAQANTKNRLMTASEAVTDCRPIVHITITKEEPELVVIYPTEDQIIVGNTPPAWTEPIKARLKNFSKGTVEFSWDMNVEWNGAAGIYTPLDGNIYKGTASATNDAWVDLGIKTDKPLLGGDQVTLHVRAEAKDYGTLEVTKESIFAIKGKNPFKNDILTVLGDDIYKSVAYTESKLNQFHSKGTRQLGAVADQTPEYPFQGGEDYRDIGIMQINNPRSDDIIWDWSANVKEGKDRLDIGISRAKVYHLRIDKSFIWDGTERNKPTPLKNNLASTDPSENQVFLQAYCYYNNDPYGNARYWRWIKGDPNRGVAGKWEKETKYWPEVVEHANSVWGAFINKSWNK
jgi:hypothetical protein